MNLGRTWRTSLTSRWWWPIRPRLPCKLTTFAGMMWLRGHTQLTSASYLRSSNLQIQKHLRVEFTMEIWWLLLPHLFRCQYNEWRYMQDPKLSWLLAIVNPSANSALNSLMVDDILYKISVLSTCLVVYRTPLKCEKCEKVILTIKSYINHWGLHVFFFDVSKVKSEQGMEYLFLVNFQNNARNLSLLNKN
jgi:hypothetical protein